MNYEDKNSLEKIYIVSKGESAESLALVITRNLRLNDHTVEIDLSRAAFNKQLKRADRSGARWAILIGEQEVEGGKVILKDLRTKEKEVSKEERVSLKTLMNRFI